MFARFVRGLSLLCLATAMVGCGSQGLDSIQVSPSSQTLAVGQTAQFVATGTFGNAKHPSKQVISSGVTWVSTAPAVATVSASGLVTAVSAGTTTITASDTAFNGPVTASAILTVTASGGGAGGGSIVSLTIIPNDIKVGNLQDTGQFLAIGTFSTAPFVRDLTNSPTLTWISAAPSVFPVSTNTAGNPGATAGVVTAYGNGGVIITAEATDPSDGTLRTANATFECPLVLPTPTTAGSCFPGSEAPALLATLTVYNEGLATANWRVTAPSASGTPYVLHCGPGPGPDHQNGSVCTATYPFTQDPNNPTSANPTSVVLEATGFVAPATSGAQFGGWSYNCPRSDANGTLIDPNTPLDPIGPNYCKVTFVDTFSDPNVTKLNTNVTVGVIFN